MALPLNHFAVVIIEAKTGTGWVNWLDTKSSFYDLFLAKIDKLRDTKKFSLDVFGADGARENRTFVEKANGAD